MATDFTSGSKPGQLKRLLSVGLEKLSPDEGTGSGRRLDLFAEKPGSRFGRYELQRVLGEGAVAVVYLAQQQQPVKRQVALKVIKPRMDSKTIIARFEAERQALALLDHPNIAQIYDAGTTEDRRPYFAMEYVEGLAVTQYCDKHRLPVKERLHSFLQICRAVHHAHQKGIIHRDIKPSNILVSIQDGEAVPKVIDFRLAKAVRGSLSERKLVTEQGQLLGTPEYMSPEQADMANQDVDVRSDIYSLGVLLYVLLTGVLPFDSASFREGGLEHVRQVIRETDAKTPSARLTGLGDEAKKVAKCRRTEAVTLARRLHKELEWIPLKAMRKERAERYGSASELADDIENYLQGVPLIAGPPSTIYRVKKFVRRHKALVTGVAAVLAVLIAGVVVSTIFAIGQAKARGVAEQQTRIARAVNDFLNKDLLASVDPEKVKGKEVTVRSVVDAASEKISGKFEGEPLIEASIRTTLGVTYRNLGEYTVAEPHLERALEIHRQKLGDEDPSTLTDMYNLGQLYKFQGRHDDAEPLFLKALESRRRVLGEDHPDTVWSMSGLADLYMSCGLHDKAEPLLVSGLEIGSEIYLEHPSMLEQMNCLAVLYANHGQHDKAERLLVKVLETDRRVLGEDHPETLQCMGNLSSLYHKQRRYDEAESLYLKTVQAKRRVLGEEHPDTVISMGNLAAMYTNQGRYDKAEPLHVKALAIRRRVLGEEHPNTLNSMLWLARLYRDQSRYDDAEVLFVKVLEGLRRVVGDNHPGTVACMRDLADLYRGQARYNEAEPLLISLVEVGSRKRGDGDAETIDSVNSLIKLYEASGKPEKAEEWRAKLPDKQAKER